MNHPSERAGASVPSGVRRSPRDEHEAPRPCRKLASIEVEHGVTVGHVEGLISIRMGMNRRSRPRRDAADHPGIAALGDIWPYNGKAFCKVVAEHDGCPTDGRHRPLLNVVPTERLVSPAILKRPLEVKLYRDARTKRNLLRRRLTRRHSSSASAVSTLVIFCTSSRLAGTLRTQGIRGSGQLVHATRPRRLITGTTREGARPTVQPRESSGWPQFRRLLLSTDRMPRCAGTSVPAPSIAGRGPSSSAVSAAYGFPAGSAPLNRP